MNLLALRGGCRLGPWLLIALVGGAGAPVGAQVLPSEPIVLGGGRVTIGGDVSFTVSCADSDQPDPGLCADDAGFFNYTDYEHSAMRMLRIDVTAAVRANDHLSVLGEVRMNCGGAPPCSGDNSGHIEPYGFYLRIRPWLSRGFDIQAGRVPPTFGAFARRTYPADNVLIGYPLAYQYLTSLRPDSLPAHADELLRMRGRGWLSSFTLGDPTPNAGLPLVNALHWDTGVQARVTAGRVDGAVSLTTGTLANPLLRDDNAGKQVAGRLLVRFSPGLLVGASAARGPFATRGAARAAGYADRSGSFTQSAWGVDAEYSRDYYLLRAEAIVSRWRLPHLLASGGTPLDEPLAAFGASVEGRYKIRPGMYAAARLDRLDFSEISGSARRDQWEAPVTRVEVGGGFSLQRNLLLKVSMQTNRREATRVSRLNLVAAQVVFWF